MAGIVRRYPTEPDDNNRKFWRKIIQVKGLDLRENERLCAIAYVKRRFVHVWSELENHEGWVLSSNVPSVSYMAAVHWLEQLIDAEPNTSTVDAFCKLANEGERLTRINCISEALRSHHSVPKALADVDGRLLFDSELDSLSKGKEDKQGEISVQKAKNLKQAKHAMLASVEEFDAPLSPFYAILMMDGDSLGETKKALADAGESPTALSKALGAFTKAVPNVVKKHNGFLIYAGGDDVLAILPLEDALPCAAACRVAYQDVFKGKLPDGTQATISAAIEYVHMKLPLTMILKDIHHLLDDVAKDQTGRDALACRTWKPGGLQQTWSVPWEIPEERHGGTLVASALATDMIDLIHEMEMRAEKKSDVGYSSKVLYGFREVLSIVMPDHFPDTPEAVAQLRKELEGIPLDKLLETSYLNSGLLDGWDDKTEGKSKQTYVAEQINKLMPLLRIYHGKAWTGLYSSDGALLLRFLAQKGVER
ncbi:MAG: type III-B CRISPR-associated protein Cas10/Cmr2 [Ghiorsea sp.]|nr:type III-B CRISPR-associated protein Cas10/Cmr2 [Ghiorsea sp.]